VVGISFAPDGIGIVGTGPVHSNTFNGIAGQFATGVAGDAVKETGVLGTSDSGTAVYGISASNGEGVVGQSASGTGMLGSSTTGTGVYGVSQTSSGAIGQSTSGDGVDGVSTTESGVFGSSTSGNGVVGVSAAEPNSAAGVFMTTNLSDGFALVAGSAEHFCWIESDPTALLCESGNSSVMHLSDDRWLRLHAVESPESWFEDFGSGQLVNGSAVIRLEPNFAETVNVGMDYRVFPVPNDDCKGLYVTQKTASSFVVRELGGGKSNASFDYRIVARQKGRENARLEDRTVMRNRAAAIMGRIAKRSAPRPNFVPAKSAGTMAQEIQLQKPIPPGVAEPAPHSNPATPNNLPVVRPSARRTQ
jgi:hypothetical protein